MMEKRTTHLRMFTSRGYWSFWGGQVALLGKLSSSVYIRTQLFFLIFFFFFFLSFFLLLNVAAFVVVVWVVVLVLVLSPCIN
jgi:hypothetical protein